jgi:N-acetylglucosamine-6-phosphate deacetylase
VTTIEIHGRDPATGSGLVVTVDGDRIAAIRKTGQGEGPWLSAGLVDLQVNGFKGIDLNSGAVTPADVVALAQSLAHEGVTTFLPTLITASEARIAAGLAAIAAAREQDAVAGAMIPFVHVEGPFIAPEDGPRGAHPLAEVRKPDSAEFDRWQQAGGNLVGFVTLSPHWPEAPAFIRDLASRGVHVAIGHTGATPEQVTAAADAGARLSTHLGNGAAAMLPRHPNFIWSQLADDRLTATFIADGAHLPAATFKAMLRAKSLDRAILVSDLAALGGSAPGIYDQPIGGKVELGADGTLRVAGTPYLAGATRSLSENVAIATQLADLSLSEALSLATINPGRFAAGRGQLQPGARADIITFDWHKGERRLDIRSVHVAGRQLV